MTKMISVFKLSFAENPEMIEWVLSILLETGILFCHYAIYGVNFKTANPTRHLACCSTNQVSQKDYAFLAFSATNCT